ncbi:unnamed protein product [Trichogramma brassicae]|uniref:Uncharacterized protein n=1 Tax=Trichogramma brassicae TaxID=86971 RepID=A0A6H5J7C9_9HYME|nr:unnamed protein product [Trichogramma brassicae]
MVHLLFEIYNRFDLNYIDERGFTHFQAACSVPNGRELVVKFLQHGQNPNFFINGYSLLRSALHNDTEWAAELLRRGADPTYVDADGSTALHTICRDGRVYLLNLVQVAVQINVPDKKGDTPLHLALESGNTWASEILLERGADPNLVNAEGSTPLHIMCQKTEGYKLVEIFFEIVDDIGKPVWVNVPDKKGNTPLHLAIHHKSTKKSEILLVNGANPNWADKDGCTALHLICNTRRHEAMKRFFEIIDENPQINLQIDAQNKNGDTPLHMALRLGSKKKFLILLEKGADPNVTNRYGWNALHFICRKTTYDFIWHFFEITDKIRRTVMIDARDSTGRTPLSLALLKANTKAAEVLLRKGADPNFANKDGWTPLHFICVRCNWFLERFFRINEERQQPVDINAKTIKGTTPLKLLRNRMPINYEEASRYLEQRGAELD